jgi:hypothetical protein
MARKLSQLHLWKLWLRWIFASGIGWLVGAVVAFFIAAPFAQSYLEKFSTPTSGVGVGFGAILSGSLIFIPVFTVGGSALQWFIYRRRANEAVYWGCVTGLGVVLGGTVVLLFIVIGSFIDILVPLVFGAVVGLIQWIAIERKGLFSRSVGVWVLASSFGWALSYFLLLSLTGLLGIFYEALPAAFHILPFAPHLILSALGGLIYGTITGIPLAQLLWQIALERNPEKASDSK